MLYHLFWAVVEWVSWAGFLIISTGIILWVLGSGFLITNLSMELEQKRSPAPDGSKHDLVTVIKLAKGRLSPAVTLQYLGAKVFSLDRDTFEGGVLGEPPPVPGERNPDPRNLSLNARGVPFRERHVLAIWTPEAGRTLNLVPTERTQYASYCVIPSDMVCETVVTLQGKRYRAQFTKRLISAMLNRIALMWPWGGGKLQPLRKRIGPWFRFKPWLRPENVYWTASIISVKDDVIPVTHPSQEGA